MTYEMRMKDLCTEAFAEGEAKGILKATINFIKSTMFNDKCSADQAMEKLHIPIEQRQYFKEHLAQEM